MIPASAPPRPGSDHAEHDGPPSRRRFVAAVSVLLAGYLVLQVTYALRLPLVMDEFQGAAAVHQLSEEMPYRDFRPYKTVLGYFLQLPVLLAAPGLWSGLIAVKLEMALLVAVTLGWAAHRLARRLRAGAVLFSLALLLSMSTFLERSAELRVDMMTALAGLVSLVLLLGRGSRDGLWAGVWAAIAVLVSQKGAFYPIAGGAALGVEWLVRRDRESLEAMGRFAVAGLTVAGAYAIFWALVSGGDPFGATIATARRALTDVEAVRQQFWLQTLIRNPAFYLLSLIGLALVVARARSGGEGAEPARRLAVFAILLIAMCLGYEQPWPYFFVLLLPFLAIVQAEGFDVLLGGSWWAQQPRRSRVLLLALIVLAGIVHPLATRVPRVMERDNDFQRYNVELAASILGPRDGYVAGVDLLWDRPQAHRRLAWLDQRALWALHTLDGDELLALIDELDASRTKLVVWNYRMANLPPLVRTYFAARFRPLTGNLMVYSPTSAPDAATIFLDFEGDYVVELAGRGPCTLAGRQVGNGQRMHLATGLHQKQCTAPMRLSFVPPGLEGRLVAQYRQPRALFPAVYHY